MRKTNGYCPLNLLGDMAASVIPASFCGLLGSEKGFSASWSRDVWCYPGEVESNSKAANGTAMKKNIPRPLLVRTLRGRVQVLPSRFHDSVIDDWRKDSKTLSLCDYSFEDEFECEKEKFSFRRKGKNCEKIGHKARRHATLCEEVLHTNFDERKYLNSKREVFVEDVELTGNGRVLKEKEERKDGLYGPEDFYVGD